MANIEMLLEDAQCKISELVPVTQGDYTVKVMVHDHTFLYSNAVILHYRVVIGKPIQYEADTYFQCLESFDFPVHTEHVFQFYEQIKQLLVNGQYKEDMELNKNLSWSDYEMLVVDQKSLFVDSHYRYLDIMLEAFWKEVFGKTASELFCGGIVSAHGDKARSYERAWEKAGINKYRGSLLFLLTYTKAIEDTPKHMSEEWVINNYLKYLPALEKVETMVLEQIQQKLTTVITQIT